MSMKDSQARAQALNIHHSYLVQAPAGSGKTELLTQRFLALLAAVEKQPEQILAITFTRKAAGEMRHRLIQRLQAAATTPRPDSPHEQLSWDLAQRVLARDRDSQWGLLENPNRLGIQTIDALCTSLAHRLPMSSRFGAKPKVSEQTQSYYRQAAVAVVTAAENCDDEVPWRWAVQLLLQHLDNRMELLIELIAEMLGTRDQWLMHCLAAHRVDDMREMLEMHLQEVIHKKCQHFWSTWHARLSAEYKETLLDLFNATSLSLDQAGQLSTWPRSAHQELAVRLAQWLLTEEGEVRKTVSKAQGFIAPSSLKNREEKQQWTDMKQSMIQCLQLLREQHQSLAELLHDIKNLPPKHYTEQQWQRLQALFTVLPIAAAHLSLIFKQHEQVDFIEIGLRALEALGTPEDPTDLTLAMDYRYQHLLVDEFQDTSMTQWQLLERLTSGWQPGDGRTLFLVGDPMQSIYRFRQAEVGLFLRAKQLGIGDIRLEFLSLSMNFRAESRLVSWVNHHLGQLFPQEENRETGAIPYAIAYGIKELEGAEVICQQYENDHAEAQAIAVKVQGLLQSTTTESIAILVRSRNHLQSLCPVFYQQGIAFQAIDIDPLSVKTIILDLIMLVRAILHLHDKMAWLAILRAPWCGMTLAEMTHLVSEEGSLSVWDALMHAGINNHFMEAMRPIMAAQGREPISRLVKTAWYRLGGEQLIFSDQMQQDVDYFFHMLEKWGAQNQLAVGQALEAQFRQLYSRTTQQARVQIMTIHKSKGLEFDTVFMPALGKRPPVEDHQLLVWTKPLDSQEEEGLILAPIATAMTDPDPDHIYRYVRGENKRQDHHEAIRVFYVGVTRARKRLYLSGCLPDSGSYLAALLSLMNSDTTESIAESIDQEVDEKPVLLKRFKHAPVIPQNPIITIPQSENPADPSYYRWRAESLKAVGTVVHRILCHISHVGFAGFQQMSLEAMLPQWRQQLMMLHVAPAALDVAVSKVKQTVAQVIQSSRAAWILGQHQEAKSEYALSGYMRGEIISGIIDRTFIEEDQRWIIDYKMTLPGAGESLVQFYEAQKQQHQKQLHRYANLMRQRESRAIRLGLYFPLGDLFVEWSFNSPLVSQAYQCIDTLE